MQEKSNSILNIRKWLGGLAKGDKKIRIIVTIGILGIVLILLSELLAPKSKIVNEVNSQESSLSVSNEKLEQQVYALVTSIDGVGRAKVMVTLDTSVEYVYAKEQKSDTDVTKDISENGNAKTSQKDKTEEKYIFVDGSVGQQPLLTTEKAPRVKGVVVVCEGGDDKLVQSRIIDAVTTAFDIGANRVCVTRMATEN